MALTTSNRQTRLGFTLIEVLVVVAIIALLVAILLPSLNNARGQARKAKCLSNLKQIYYATMGYVNAHGDFLPDDFTLGRWSYRRAPGDTDPGSTGPNPMKEIFGLAATLHGMVKGGTDGQYQPAPTPRYLSGRSSVWICPAAANWLTANGNTYWFNVTINKNNPPTDPIQPLSKLLRVDRRLATPHTNSAVPWVMDNVKTKPMTAGWMGPLKGSTLMPASMVTIPHAYVQKKNTGSTGELWATNAVYLDGRTQQRGADDK